MYFGVDYHPEQWVYPYGGTAEQPEAAWERDAELMRTAGVNVVRMGEITWGLCEPEEGKSDFYWLKRVMKILGKVGIKVVLATPNAAPPVWLASKYPEQERVQARPRRAVSQQRSVLEPFQARQTMA
jgi:beta-galactosidase